MADIFENRMQAKRDYFRAKFPDQFAATGETCVVGLEGYKTVIEASDAVLIKWNLVLTGGFAGVAVIGEHGEKQTCGHNNCRPGRDGGRGVFHRRESLE